CMHSLEFPPFTF
nr:immunoglobulin light chain junction region [Macaca mulatta]